MKTQTQKNTNKSAEIKTSMISIPPYGADALKSLQANAIPTRYLGLDQSGRLLMEIDYTSDQAELIRQITTQMQKSEELVAEFTHIFNQTIDKLTAETDKAWNEKIKAYKLKFKKRRKTIKTESHGNQ